MHRPVMNAAHQTYVLVAINLGILSMVGFTWYSGNAAYMDSYESSSTQVWNTSHSNMNAAMGISVASDNSLTTVQYIPNGDARSVSH